MRSRHLPKSDRAAGTEMRASESGSGSGWVAVWQWQWLGGSVAAGNVVVAAGSCQLALAVADCQMQLDPRNEGA
jgi:hypothetical protein